MGVPVNLEVATLRHAELLGQTMREADKRELWSAYRMTPYAALREGLDVSREAWAGVLPDGEVLAMWGVRLFPAPQLALGWCLSGEAVQRHKREYLRLSRIEVARLAEKYGPLHSFIDASYRGAVEWAARYLGAVIGSPFPVGPDGVPFHLAIFDAGGVRWAQQSRL